VKLSIILPVYNTSSYLRQCLDSILSQLKNHAVELIIVNDGSTDNSAVILDAYAAKYNEIQLHHRKNVGVYPTRNFALEQARGDYIWMLDSDDYLLDGALATLMNEIKTHPEVEIFTMGFELECKDGTSVRKHAKFTNALCTGIEYLAHNQGSFFLWRNVYKKAFLEEQHLQFEAKVFREPSVSKF
jgi:glycosyltransferase involved in cell wall biosynthesis